MTLEPHRFAYRIRTSRYNTLVIPLRLSFQPGASLYEQVVYAVKRAVISGQIRPGTPFPSVRTLSKELKINPNTAHKVITQLIGEGLLEVRVGVGTIVAAPPPSAASERSRLLKGRLEQLVVEAKRLGVDLDTLLKSVSNHWQRLSENKDELNTCGKGSSGRK
jgi:GntR family transcriptional regulator